MKLNPAVLLARIGIATALAVAFHYAFDSDLLGSFLWGVVAAVIATLIYPSVSLREVNQPSVARLATNLDTLDRLIDTPARNRADKTMLVPDTPGPWLNTDPSCDLDGSGCTCDCSCCRS